MSSEFVSGGTTEKPTERDDEWLKAQQEIEANRRRKEEESRQQGGKSLYEVLQSNKAAKEEAFQESIKLKNQFRNLDEDEVEFLDSVLESTRAKEQAVKRETSEQLDLFRRQQEEAEKAALDGNISNTTAGSPTDPSLESQWALNARKRKRVKEDKGLKGVKIRRSSTSTDITPSTPGHSLSADQSTSTIITKDKDHGESRGTSEVEKPTASPSPKATNNTALPLPSKMTASAKAGMGAGLGLADYSSDDE